MGNTLYTVGYESATIDDFVATLKAVGIELVIDVRDYPLSRKKGFSKNKLHEILEANDIAYIHLKGLGDPKEGREAARSGDHKRFLLVFNKHMKTHMAQTDLQTAIGLAHGRTSCLLCYERKPEECHRTIVAEAIAADTAQRIVPIGIRNGIALKTRATPLSDLSAYAQL